MKPPSQVLRVLPSQTIVPSGQSAPVLPVETPAEVAEPPVDVSEPSVDTVDTFVDVVNRPWT